MLGRRKNGLGGGCQAGLFGGLGDIKHNTKSPLGPDKGRVQGGETSGFNNIIKIHKGMQWCQTLLCMADIWELKTEEPQLWNYPRSKLKKTVGKLSDTKACVFFFLYKQESIHMCWKVSQVPHLGSLFNFNGQAHHM